LLDIILGGESAECGLAIPVPFHLLVILRRCVIKVVIIAHHFFMSYMFLRCIYIPHSVYHFNSISDESRPCKLSALCSVLLQLFGLSAVIIFC
jgi:hypothetical protein